MTPSAINAFVTQKIEKKNLKKLQIWGGVKMTPSAINALLTQKIEKNNLKKFQILFDPQAS